MQIDITETNFVRALAAGLIPADEAIKYAQGLVGWVQPPQDAWRGTLAERADDSCGVCDDDLRQALRDWCVRFGPSNAAALLQGFFVKNVTELLPAAREGFVAACNTPADTVDEFFAKVQP